MLTTWKLSWVGQDAPPLDGVLQVVVGVNFVTWFFIHSKVDLHSTRGFFLSIISSIKVKTSQSGLIKVN